MSDEKELVRVLVYVGDDKVVEIAISDTPNGQDEMRYNTELDELGNLTWPCHKGA